MEASQDVELTGTNRPSGLNTPLKRNLRCLASLCSSQKTSTTTHITLVTPQICGVLIIEDLTPTPVTLRGWLSRKRFGGYGGGETPGPIPNPEVKPFSADGTAWETGWESRTPPDTT